MEGHKSDVRHTWILIETKWIILDTLRKAEITRHYELQGRSFRLE